MLNYSSELRKLSEGSGSRSPLFPYFLPYGYLFLGLFLRLFFCHMIKFKCVI
jgi:hypothetical protein